MRWFSLLVLALLLAPAASPEGNAVRGQIAYSRRDGDRYLLHVMNADGSGDRLLPGQMAAVNFSPAWSPDGKRLAFQSGASAEVREFQINILNADGTGLMTLDNPNGNPGTMGKCVGWVE